MPAKKRKSTQAGSSPAKAASRKRTIKPENIYQFKITLIGSDPPIWRRIEIKDGTLDELHEHIQTAMGWTNSHLHEFMIRGVRFGDPQLLLDGSEIDREYPFVSSLETSISSILPLRGQRFRFLYNYDFGDNWEHEILFEGSSPSRPRVKYPRCVEGERACPPEDCGGIGGFEELLQALKNPRKRRYQERLDWLGPFDPEDFDTSQATKAMQKGLPDWRNE